MDPIHPPAVVRAAADLRILAAEINAAHQAGEDSTRRGLEHFREAGRRLLKAKEQVGHGGWKAWLDQNITFSQRTATDYMRLAREWPKLAAAANLRDALRLLTEDANETDASALTPPPTTTVTPESGTVPPDSGHVQADEPDEGPEPDGPPQTNDADEAVIVDAEGKSVPERLKPLFACVPLFERAVRLAERLANTFQDIEQTPLYCQAVEGTKHPVYSTYFRSAARALRSMTPRRLCPGCGGEFEPSLENDPCQTCRDRGYLTAEEADAC
jgi:hypothetical protein